MSTSNHNSPVLQHVERVLTVKDVELKVSYWHETMNKRIQPKQ